MLTVLAQVSLEIIEKYSARPETSADGKEVARVYGQEWKERLREMTRMVDKKAVLRESVAEMEKEEKALKRKLKAPCKGIRWRWGKVSWRSD